MTDDKILNEILTTSGIASPVYEDGGEVVGHVMLVDYDADDGKLQQRAEGLPGITLVFQSSKDRYHLWNLSVRSRSRTLMEMLDLRGDDKHTAVGWRRGRWILRTTDKNYPKRGIYREAPKLQYAYANETKRQQSLGHFAYADAHHDIPIPPDSFEWAGDHYPMEKYMTLTDEGKRWVQSVYDG